MVSGCAKKEAPPKNQEQQQEKAKENGDKQKTVFVSSNDKPEACTSCHADENSLNALTKIIEGHPQVQANTVSECAGCHKEESDLSLEKIIHERHTGSCVHCHKEAEGGDIFIPGLAPAETESVTIEVAQTDKSPNGCLDCHKNDYSIPNTVKKIPGHPEVNFEDFNQCYSCHGAEAPELGTVLHNKHLGSDTFKKNYDNSCLNCHKRMDDGKVVVKGKK